MKTNVTVLSYLSIILLSSVNACVDKNPSCATWAAIGECSANPCYMLPNCPVSCKDCQGQVSLGSGDCLNTKSECPCWASQGRCGEETVRLACKKSCDKKCGGGGPDPNVCADISLHCAIWAAAGECKKTPVYMNQFCKATCKKCPAKPKCNTRFACPTVYDPVCGTDGQTYSNSCFLDLESCKKSGLKVAKEGECANPCRGRKFCTLQYDPVCGTDGHTYSNDCFLGLARCKNPSLRLAYRGQCEQRGAATI